MPPLATAFIRTVIQKPADKDFAEVEAATAASGEKSAGGFGASFRKAIGKEADTAGKSFSEKLGAGIGEASKKLAEAGTIGGALGLVEAIKQGSELEDTEAKLAAVIGRTGTSFAAQRDGIDKADAAMEKLGFTYAQTNEALTTLTVASGDVRTAELLLGDAANLARLRNVSLADATKLLQGGLAGNAKSVKQLGITIAQGATSSKAFAAAQSILNDRIKSAGGIAGFAAQNHLSLAEAERLVAQASGQASKAQEELAGHGTTLASVTRLIGEAQGGDVKAVSELAKLHLTLAQAQRLATAAAGGSITAFNKLGIEVLPKSATAAQRAAQMHALLQAKIGDVAKVAAGTAAGQLEALRAKFTDVAAQLGEKLIPVLVKVLEFFTKSGLLMPLLLTAMGALTAAILVQAAAWAITPFGLITIAVAALVVGIIELKDHWNTVWTFMSGVIRSFLSGPIAVVRAGMAQFSAFWAQHGDEIKQVWQVVWGVIRAVTVVYWGFVFAYLKTGLGVLEAVWITIWDLIRDTLKAVWAVMRTVVTVDLGLIRDVIGVILDVITGHWARAWADLKKLASDALNGTKLVILTIFSAAGTWLYNAGRDIVGGLLRGIGSIASGIGSWINNNLVQPIIGAVKHFFGVRSPSTVMAEIGGHIVSGLVLGVLRTNPVQLLSSVFGSMPNALGAMISKGFVDLAKLPLKALSALSGAVGSVWHFITGAGGTGGSGVQRWTALAASVLRMLGQPLSDLGTVMTQMNTESGGNPTIVNRSDINWQEGHPSVGLMQVIGGTFDAYAGPFRNVGPFEYGVSVNPLANIFAGLNYAVHRYGAGWTQVLGHGHGYAGGGPITEPIAGIGLRTGETYTFGERGDETVIPGGMRRGGRGGGGSVDDMHDTLAAMADNLDSLLRWLPDATGASVAGVLDGIGAAGVRAAHYGAR